MPRYVAFLRGVSPMNAKMPELKRAFEAAGFTEVKTLLSSGNVVFNARSASEKALAQKAEKAMQATLGNSFGTFIRKAEHLQELIAAEPFAEFPLSADDKCVVTFLEEVPKALKLPIVLEDARILKIIDREVLCAYTPGPNGPVFMRLLEKTFGKKITTRTLDTVKKCAKA
ncbi:DUF1697 domain-containing protein [Uliginosibacterium sp. H3]|uniref:DUF1697 domain-containing protein n=1 Tax=Uliginosibacterium silvisoli TaxID=3114758 RepID=A0ABU6K748_9RHOO|nr:DUF1697 domain-containing protein [Uliginosibacterium sp. H3]